MCRRLTILFLACVLLLTIRPALAVVVYDHGLNTRLCCFTDNDFDAFSPEEYAEDFSLAGAATIRSVKLRGVYLSGGPTVTDNFTFSFYADAGGTPDTTAFASFNVGTGSSLTRVDTGIDLFSQDVYEFEADLGAGVALTGGTTYYFGLHNDTTGETPTFYIGGWRGSGSPWERDADVPGASWGTLAGVMDVAFQLNDENSAEQVAVPEPAPLAALTIGVIGAIALRRRRAA